MEKDMDNDMQISAREIEELIEGGIAFTKNRVLKFEECEQMEKVKGCIALQDIIGNPPYFAFFYPTKKQRLRIVFDDKNAFHRLYMHIKDSGYQSLDIKPTDDADCNWRQQKEILVSKKFALLKKPVNPSRFRTHPAVPELSALCIILAVFLKGGKNVSADSA